MCLLQSARIYSDPSRWPRMPASAPGEVLQGATVMEVRSLLHHLEGPLQTGKQPLPKGAGLSPPAKTLNHFHASLAGQRGVSRSAGPATLTVPKTNVQLTEENGAGSGCLVAGRKKRPSWCRDHYCHALVVTHNRRRL